jgi:hypothetical protein
MNGAATEESTMGKTRVEKRKPSEELLEIILADLRKLVEDHLGFVETKLHKMMGTVKAEIALGVCFEQDDDSPPSVRCSARVKLPGEESPGHTLAWRAGGQLQLDLGSDAYGPGDGDDRQDHDQPSAA